MSRAPSAVCAPALLAVGLVLLPPPAAAGEKAAARPAEVWPVAVQARYRLRYNGIDVGQLHVNSTTAPGGYSLSGSGKVSVLFGAITWAGSSIVSGIIEAATPAPANYSFEWRNNRKGGTIRMGYRQRIPTEIAVEPPPGTGPDYVPVTDAHKVGAIDPVSAIMMLTRADGRPPCERRVGIFDGKQRYDIVLTPKRQIHLPAPTGGGPAETGHVCRVMYEPVAGHRANAATRTYASNRDVEVVMRRLPGSDMLMPMSVTVPTFWGTGSMVTERIDITTRTVGRIALTE